MYFFFLRNNNFDKNFYFLKDKQTPFLEKKLIKNRSSIRK